jgi:hypothetical protein
MFRVDNRKNREWGEKMAALAKIAKAAIKINA